MAQTLTSSDVNKFNKQINILNLKLFFSPKVALTVNVCCATFGPFLRSVDKSVV